MMEVFKRVLRVAALLALGNSLILFGRVWPLPFPWGLLCIAGLLVFFIYFNIRPRKGDPSLSLRLRSMLGGYELLLCAVWVLLLETAGLIWAGLTGRMDFPNIAVCLLLFLPMAAILLLNGFFRVLVTCGRLRLVWRLALLFLWWVPLVNLVVLGKALSLARAEYRFALARQHLETLHAENQDCATRYPLVLVHGIFFRDWQYINYWGRIPQALQKCGATVYYGSQQSSAPVARSAQELKERVEAVLAETGAEKVNLIAHSKGGLDSRYAISRLGLGPRVASLTTINTPHRGCIFAQHLLETLPRWLIGWMEKRYNGLFHALGDAQPDFLGGVNDLTHDACLGFNESVPDVEGVLYQSVTSTMKSPRSAAFPLDFTWRLVNKYDKEANDGLVAESSAHWGNYLRTLTVPGRRGISHGDVIDLMREDIAGFDVREFYTELVKDLKEKGL